MQEKTYDVIVIGGGPAGLAAALFTARADLSTLIVEAGTSILKRNAILENYLGFPAGIDSRLFLEMAQEQAVNAGAAYIEDFVTAVERTDDTFAIKTRSGNTHTTNNIIIATKTTPPSFDTLGISIIREGSKRYIETDRSGRTNVPGIYAAGRVTKREHQAIVAAGSGAETALALIKDVNADYTHDWVAPDGYFTNRGKDIPRGCEEISHEERTDREQHASETLRAFIGTTERTSPVPHPAEKEQET